MSETARLGQADVERRRHAASAVLVSVLAAAALTGCEPVASEAVTPQDGAAVIIRNGRLSPTPELPFRFEDLREPQLDTLAGREQLRRVIEDASSQFDQIVRLRDWVASQWPVGTPDPYPPWNALTVLDWIRDGRTGGFCGQYSQVLLQSLAALGFTARYVEIGSRDNPYAHFVVEVWSNDHDKWVVMDADYNLHFERGGLPLSALDIHDAVVQSQFQDLSVRSGPSREGHSDPGRLPFRTAELYYYVRFHLKADHLSHPDEPPFDRFTDMIEWEDAGTVPWETSTVVSEYPKVRLTEQSTADREAAEPALNQVQVSLTVSDDLVVLELRNNVLQMDHYEYRVVGMGLPDRWKAQDSPRLVVRRGEGRRRVEIRGVNVRGVSGPPAVVEVRTP